MVLELFGPEFKEKLFEELVELNVKALNEAKRKSSRYTTWVPIKKLQEETGWGRTKLEEWRDQGKFQYQQSGKGGKYLYNLEDVQRFCRSMQK
jgi:hypothetical protein